MITGRQRLVLGVVAILVCELITVGGTIAASRHQDDRVAINALAIALLAIPPLLLPLRLKWPVQMLAFALACVLAYSWIGFPGGPIYLALGTAYFTTARLGHRRWAIASLIVGYIGIVWMPALLDTPGDNKVTVGGALGVLAWLLVLFAIGEIVRTRARFVEQFDRSREEERQRQISDERLRIARELHDVLAHNVSLINVQAGVALHLIDERPEQAREALTNIKAASAETLREMRSVLGVLRGVDEEAPRAPAPSLSRLDALIASAAAAGVDVDSSVAGSVAQLPAGVDVAAYRIVQEALTNVARHAGRAAHARVVVDYRDDALTVQVDDDGAGAAPVIESPGTGRRDHRDARARDRARRIARGAAAAGRRLPRAGRSSPGRCDVVIRVLLADDQALVRGGFRALLDAQPDIDVVGEAADGSEAVRLARELVPTVVLMDVRMPEMDGIEATRAIAADRRLCEVRVVILTTFELDEYVFEALRAGASGFLVKDTEPAELVRGVQAVARGDALLSPGVTRRLIAEFASSPASATAALPSLDELTEREREVMALAAGGLSNDEIAERLVLSPLTAKTHVSRAMVKLGARDRAQLVVMAYESGLVRPGWAG